MEPRASKQLRKLDPANRKKLQSYLDTIPLDNPRAKGKNFTGDLKPMWGYRCDDLRVVCWMEDEGHVLKVVSLGNRREVYAGNGLLREA